MGAAARYLGVAVALLEITLVLTALVRLGEDRNYIGQTIENQLKARALFIEEQLGTAHVVARLAAARGIEAERANPGVCATAADGTGDYAHQVISARLANRLQGLWNEFRSKGIHRLRYSSPCLAAVYPAVAASSSGKKLEAVPGQDASGGWSSLHVPPGDADSVVSWSISDPETKSTAAVEIAASWLWRMTLPMEGAVNEIVLFSDNRRVVAQASEPVDFSANADLTVALGKVPTEAAARPDRYPSEEAVFASPMGKLTHAGDWYTASMKVADSPFVLSVFVPFSEFWWFIVDRNTESIIGISIIGVAIFVLYWLVSWRILRPAAAAQRESMELFERLQAIFGAVHDGILLTDPDKAIISTNRSLESLLRVPAALLQPGTQLDVVAEHLRGRSAVLSDALLEVTDSHDGSVEVEDGSGHWLYLRTAAIQETGQVVTVVSDTTMRRELEDALGKARDEAESAARAKSAFLATMSHEIRTPMNGIVSVAEMLEDTSLDDDQRTLIRIIRNSGDVLQTVINDILDFSKIEAGKLEIERIPFDPVDTVDIVGRLLAPRAEEQSTDLSVVVDPRIPRSIVGDPTRLKQILLNLGGNAIKFTKDGSVDIKVGGTHENDGYRLHVEVVDTGIGMTEEQQKGLFTPFRQADSSTSRRFGGSGLGLSICSTLTEMMGGAIGCSSEWQRGSTFWFELPMSIRDAESHRPDVDITDARVALVGYGSTDAAILRSYLGYAGATVVVESNPDDVLADIQSALRGVRDADAVLLNARSGLELLKPILPAVWAEVTAGRSKLIVSGPYMARSLLRATGSGDIDIFASLSAPVSMRRLWHVIAAAQGKVDLTKHDSVGPAIPHFAPPTREAARKANAVVLVAEDNVTNQQVIRRILSRVGYACEIASNGTEALSMLDRGGYGILLTDIHMPTMDGFELTKEIRRREAADGGTRLNVVALTADALSQTEASCREAGMDGYLRKPVVVKNLVDILERVVPQGIALRREIAERAPRASAEKGGAEPEISPPKPESVAESVLDLSGLEETFGELDASVYEIVIEFVDSTSSRLDDLRSHLDARDTKAAGEGAHAMKGAALSVGALDVGRLALDLEAACKRDDCDSARAILDELGAACLKLTSAAAPLRERMSA